MIPGNKLPIFLAVMVFAAFLAISASCVKRSAPVGVDPKSKTEKQEEEKKAEKELVKPALDSEKTKADEKKPETLKPQEDTTSTKSKTAQGPVKNPKTKDRKTKDSEETEESAIIPALKELAQSVGGVTLAKLCYVKEDDEWWIMLYRESAGKVDLKQFIWNRHSEKPEPFLVIREFSRGRMNIEMKKNEEGKECKVIKLEEDKQKTGEGK